MYTPINGWTKESMIKHIKDNFTGRSVTSDGSCHYRGPKGRKCAVGMFIPDDRYDDNMDDGDADKAAIVVIPKYGLGDCMPLPTDAMGVLQRVHDETDTNNDVLKRMIAWVFDNVVGAS